jgi:hypothetical protein
MPMKDADAASPAAAGVALWEPEFSWILDTLAVGGSFPRGVAARLARECGIGAVIDVRLEDSDHVEELAACGLAFLRLPTEDTCAVSQEMLDAGVAFARDAAGASGRLLIHCQHGIGRSALVALCVLVDRGYPPMRALALAKDARERISPSRPQFEAWAEWVARRAPQHPAPGYEEFARVAYRHLQGG